MIELRPITPDNHIEARKIAVRPEQERFVASIDKSLADAYVWKDAMLRIAFEDDQPVGYVTVFPFDDDGQRVVNIVRLMVDARFQGKGLGRELLARTVDWIGTFAPSVDLVRISTLPDNEVALGLYKNTGFTERGIEDGEVALYRPLDRPLHRRRVSQAR